MIKHILMCHLTHLSAFTLCCVTINSKYVTTKSNVKHILNGNVSHLELSFWYYNNFVGFESRSCRFKLRLIWACEHINSLWANVQLTNEPMWLTEVCALKCPGDGTIQLGSDIYKNTKEIKKHRKVSFLGLKL